MSEFIIQDVTLSEIANAIRGKTSKTEDILVSDFADEITSISSGTELNFEVVGGTTQPTNPKENTIWINTSVPIAEWRFSTDNPDLVSENINYTSDWKTHYLDSSGDAITLTDGSCCITDFIQLPNNTASITIPNSYSGNIAVYHCFYNNSGNIISIVKNNPSSPTYTVPNGAVKVQLSVKDSFGYIIANVNRLTEGNVWICTGSGNVCEFNALKENGIQVYPISAKQCVNGTWVDKAAKIYQNGEWVNWFDGYLFNYGKQSVKWQARAWQQSNGVTAIKPTVTQNTDGSVTISITVNSGMGSGAYELVEDFDLTNVKTLIVDFTDGYLFVTPRNAQYYGENSVASLAAYTGNRTLDVSGISGKYDIVIGCLRNSYNAGAGTTSVTFKTLVAE